MTDIRLVYLVVVGLYEGFEVLAVYDQESDANTAAKAINDFDEQRADAYKDNYLTTDARVEPYVLNPPISELVEVRRQWMS